MSANDSCKCVLIERVFLACLQKESEWQTAYTAEFVAKEGERKEAATTNKVKQASLSKMPRLHLKMGLRDY
jgi:hypothetical protein